jgi:DNA helicase-2/ATP-dependent DNA helicase PcrA
MSADTLDTLNEAQRKAVQAVYGPVLVLAGPGSGKTKVLTHRVGHLIEDIGVDPHHILAVTFTNKAAREMKERLENLVGPGRSAALTVGTFHSLCTRFLRRDIVHLGRERDFAIYDSDDQERLMRRVLRDLNLDEKRNPPRAIHAAISSAKNELVGPDEYARLNRTPFDRTVADCYRRYQALLRESNALDFDDLLVETVRLFQEHPEVLARYHERYRFLLVDEYQDTNRAQYLIVKLLAQGHRNLFTVGDTDQGVYSWRGADIRNILQFEDDYPDAQVILLEQNYRSTQGILDVAQAVINSGEKRRHAKNLWTENGEGVQVSLQEAYDHDEEARLVADEITRLVSRGDDDGRRYELGECAIMYRTNAQSRAIEEALLSRGLRYHIVGGIRFYERKEVKDSLAYLRLALNPNDSVSLLRVINVPGRGIGDRTEEELGRWAAALSMPIFHALRDLARDEGANAGAALAKPSFAARTRSALLRFLTLLEELLDARNRLGLVELLDLALERLEFRDYLLREYGPDEGEDRWNNVQELRNVASEYAGLPREAQLPTFLEEVALVADVDSMDKQTDVVTCITLHQAKGLEYPVVFLVGLEEGLLPHSRSTDDRDKLEEERRLLYVGATRAKRRLYLLYAFRRTTFGRTNTSVPSRFLADIPRSLLKQQPKRERAPISQSSLFSQRSSYGASRNAPPASRNTPPAARGRTPADSATAHFTPGTRVRHATFGDGIVLSSKPIEGDEEVTVAFEQKGQRRLLASFANLQKL